jgi:hypothetical protein
MKFIKLVRASMGGRVTRENHYVPVWYQRGFLISDQSQPIYLDLAPDKMTLGDGKVVTLPAMRKWGPKIASALTTSTPLASAEW